jgi:hypothetical protein
MKGLAIAVIFLSMAAGMMAQGQPVPEKDMKKAVVTLYQVAEFPTNPVEHSPGAEYIQDYKVLAKKELSKVEVDSLKPILADSSNYIFNVAKSCPFIAMYALRIEKKTGVTDIIISRESCIKLIIKSSAESEPRYYDLRKQNAIFPLLEKMIGEKEVK